MSHHVYVLRSVETGKRYVGSTSNLMRRLNEHNVGKVSSTKSMGTLELIYQETFSERFIALKREKFFKTGKGREILKILLARH